MHPDHAPRLLTKPPVAPGSLSFAAVQLDHPHIYDQCRGLISAGAELASVYDPQPERVEAFRKVFPQARVARSLDEVLADPRVALITAAAVPCDRGPLGCRVMQAGKDYLTDKPPFTTLDQLAEARRVSAATGRKYMVFFGGRLGVECAVHAERLIREGAVGRVLQVIGLGPHRIKKPQRPAWFFERARYGGILCDLGSHQCDLFLAYSGSTDAEVLHAAVGNFGNPDTPELEDFGEASLLGSSGATNHHRVDWFTPAGQSTWGDGRMFVLGTRGTIELRSFCDVAQSPQGDLLILVDEQGEHRMSCGGRVGLPFYGDFVRDCLARTETAMTQAQAFKASEFCLRTQAAARRVDRLPASS
ncbi:MAG: Gfo/Idh/MocA family oxidoreductase [Verrucomicrobia bacterium]|nr:Gfo/Idh/MocA family oxidoreductase [Verrucomicrobiota bacterium]